VGTQAHPELRSRPNRAHPLFRGLIAAALERNRASRLFEVAEPGPLPENDGEAIEHSSRLEAESAGVTEHAEV